MATKMKGLLKGLRYISQIFDTSEKEREMEIGYPTDVKHVAHIGWDGPSVNTPSWMNEFRSAPEFSSAPLIPTGTTIEPLGPKSASQDLRRLTETDNSAQGSPRAPRRARRHRSSGGAPVEPDSPDFLRPANRHPSVGEPSDSSAQEPSKPTRPSRRRPTHGSAALYSPTRDDPGVPRQSRQRRNKGSSVGSIGGSTSRDSRSKATLTLTEGEPAKAPEESQPPS